MMDTNKF
jgi:hypothetical protein